MVVVPDRMMHHHRSKTHHCGFAASMSTARGELDSVNLEEDPFASPDTSSPEEPSSPMTPADTPTADSFAFAFDIDGVLIRGGKPIPEAVEAMKVLNGENEYGMKVYVCSQISHLLHVLTITRPYIFLTNGGGKTEVERCIDLSRQLDIEVSPAQFICGM